MSGIQSHPNREQTCVPLIRWIALLGHKRNKSEIRISSQGSKLGNAQFAITFVPGVGPSEKRSYG
jgi:hypothetical protein